MFKKTKLSTFFEANKKTDEHILLIDANNLVYRTLFIANLKAPDDNTDFAYWKHLFINNIFNSIRQFEPTKLIFAFDGHKLWRKEIFNEYKAHRKEARNKSTIDFKKFFPVLDDVMNQMKAAFANFHIVKLEQCESDDFIAVLTRERFKDAGRVTIISTDKDFIQLLKQDNVEIYNPIQKKMIASINPKKDLQIKILMGDTSDNIPPVKKGTGPKTADKIVNGGLEIFLESSQDIKKAFERNRSIIDFDYIPKNIVKDITKYYDEYKSGEYNGQKAWQFLLRNKLEQLADNITNFSGFIRQIK